MVEKKRLAIMDEPILVRVEEAARLLSLSKSMIYQLINRGDLRATPPGGPRRVLRSSIDEWVDRMTSGGRQP